MNLFKKTSSVAVLTMFMFTAMIPSAVYARTAPATANDSIETATSITLNNEVTGYAATENEEEKDEYYKFTIPSNGDLTMNFKHDPVRGYDSDDGLFEIEILDADENVYKTIDADESDTNLTKDVGLKAGTYYVHIDSTYDDQYTSLKYSFNLGFNASEFYEKEDNDEVEDSNAITLGNYYYGQLSDEDDEDFYKFTTTAAGKVNVEFDHDQIANGDSNLWRIDVIDKNSNIYETIYSAGEDKTNSAIVGLPQGDYYLDITNCDEDGDYSVNETSTSYKLKVSVTVDASYEQEFNDNAASANPIELQKTYNGTINYREYDNEDYDDGDDYDDDDDYDDYIAKPQVNKNYYDKEEDEQDQVSDVDFYTFNLANSKKVNIKFGHERVKDESDGLWDVKIINSRGNTVKEYSAEGNSGTRTYKIKLSSGRYYISVSPTDDYDSEDQEDTSCMDLNYSIRVN